MNWKEFITFRKMVTPVIIQVIFWIGVAGVVIGGLIAFVGGLISGIGNGSVGDVLMALFGAPIGVVVGLLLVRLYTELLIVIFRIHDSLVEIEQLLRQRGA